MLKETPLEYHKYHLDQAYQKYREGFDKLMKLLDLGDLDKPIEV